MDDRATFWSQKDSWPRDAMGFVFLARAVDEVGGSLFPQQWEGNEATTPDPYDLVWRVGPMEFPLLQSDAKPWQKQQIFDLLLMHWPNFEHGPIEYSTGPDALSFTDNDWSAGCQIGRDIDRKNAPARQRFAAVILKMRDALADGFLVSVLRDRHGGSFSSAANADLWNIETAQLNKRLYCCQMNPRQPFGIGVAGDAYKLIFITRVSLDTYKSSLQQTKQAAPGDDSGRPRQAEYGRWYKQQIDASPTRRTISKTDAIKIGVKDYKLSKRQAESERNAILSEFPKSVRDAWRKSGP